MSIYNNELKALKKVNRLRERKIYDDNLVDFASNDYLGLSQNKETLAKAYKRVQESHHFSSRASMLVNGYHPIHKLLEDYLRELNGFEDGVVLGSGFLANISLFESLVRKTDLLIIDEEYHASGILASKLVTGEVRFFKHNDMEDLEYKLKDKDEFKRVFIAVEGVYSMHGDLVPSSVFLYAKNNVNIIVDEAHSVGVLGSKLLGILDYYNIENKSNIIKMGTLSKSLCSYGAYILASSEIISFLENRAKPIIYSTAISPFDTSLAYENLVYIQKNLENFKQQILDVQSIVKEKLKIELESLILPLPQRSSEEALTKQNKIMDKGFLVGAIRPPTVKEPILRIIPKISEIKEFKKLVILL